MADNAFDAWVSSGVFTRKQVPLNAFEELIRIFKPGGLIMIALRVEDKNYYYNKIKEYCNPNILKELWQTRLAVLKSCNHDLLIFKKNYGLHYLADRVCYRVLIAIVPPYPNKEGQVMKQELQKAQLPVFNTLIRRTTGYQQAAMKGV